MALNVALYSQSSVSVSSTEYSLTNNSTSIATQSTPAIVSLWLDASAMAAGDEYEVAMQEKIVSGGTQRRIVLANLVGVQADPYVSPSVLVGVGWDFTLKKISGTDRSFSWSVRSVA